MLEREGDVLGGGLLLEELVLVADERDEVGLPHVHNHLSLVDFPQVHHLVDEVQDALRVLLDNLVDALPLWVFVGLDEREQWGDDEGQRGADVVADVDEETELGLAHLFRVDVALQQ